MTDLGSTLGYPATAKAVDMRQRFLWLIILIVLLPVGLLTWFGVRFASSEKVVTQQRFQQLMQERLSDVNRQVAAQFEETERSLQRLTAFDTVEVDSIRELVRTKPQVSQVFVLHPNGELLYPQPDAPLNVSERNFLQQASKMFTGKDLQNAVALREAEQSRSQNGAAMNLGMLRSGPPLSETSESAPALLAQNPVDSVTNTLPQIPGTRQPAPPGFDPFGNDQQQVQSLTAGAAVPPAQPSPSTAPDEGPAQVAAASPIIAASPAQATPFRSPGQREEARQQASVANVPQAPESAGRSRTGPPNGLVVPPRGFGNGPERSLPPVSQDPVPDTQGGSQGRTAGLEFTPSPNLAQSSGSVNDVDNRYAPQMGGEVIQSRAPWPQSSGWFVWYWDRGMNLIYWQRRPSGNIVGAALERSRWISDLMCALPETDVSRSNADAVSFRVVGSASEMIYTWGPEWPRNSIAFCELPLAGPLASWRLQCFVPATLIPSSGGTLLFNLITGLTAVTLTLSAMGWVLYRDYSRDLREASQQVSFVNQVSHELKTPLTNIRMYAELLENDIDNLVPEDLSGGAHNGSTDPRRRLDVITSEAQRLSRLIGNVLTFARQQRKTLQVHAQPVRIVEVVKNIIDRFAPSLAEHQIMASVTGSVDGTHRIDTDFLEQILGNLISNVEKYAVEGRTLLIHVSSDTDRVLIDVKDAGPGIPAQYREEVFRPFARLDNDVRSASGTGIGLTIARELAREHGGDLILMSSEKGCWFQIQLRPVA